MNATPRSLGRYELQTQLGRGGVGEVWKAYDRERQQDIVIKTLHTDLQADPHFLTRFQKAGRALASISHSNIVQIYAADIVRPAESNETTAYIVMEYVEGQTLSQYIHSTSHRGFFPSIAQIIYLFTAIGQALDYLHHNSIVHGDIKPNNILLNKHDKTQFEAGEPKLSDFGLTQLLGDTVTIASPLYMSPEQAKGLPANKRSDIYALGVILYEICTGVQPFRAESSVAVMMQHINNLPTPPILINPHIPPALSEVILRALAKDPATRFFSGAALAAALIEACSLQPTRFIPQQREIMQEEATHQDLPILGVAQPRPQVSSRQLSGQAGAPKDTASFSAPAADKVQPLAAGPATEQGTAKETQQLLATAVDRAATAKVARPTLPSEALVPMPPPPAPPPQPAAQVGAPPLPLKRPRQSVNEVPLHIVVAALLLLLLVISSVIGASILQNNKHVASSGGAHVFFQDDALGNDDQLRIEIQNIAPPPSGQSYIAWLKTSSQQTQFLGPLNMQNNTASFLYPGDDKHTNLLSLVQGVLITQENAGSHPNAPTGKVLYQGSFNPTVLQHLQAILYDTPDLPGRQGIMRGLLDTVKSMNDKAGSIVDSLGHDPTLARRQATRIIELVDGSAYAKSRGDLPPQVSPLLNTQVGLFSSPQHSGYIDLLAAQLDQIKPAANNNAQLSQHIQNIENAITDLRDWAQQIRDHARQILLASNLTDTAVANAALELQHSTDDAYTGRTIAAQAGPQPMLGSAGAYQAYVETQSMASLDLQKM